MLNKLQKKWHVGPMRLILIIITFAIAGSVCGYTGRKLLGLTNIEKEFIWILLYIITISILWPIAVLIVSIPLGQFSFFKRYLRNMYDKIIGKRKLEDKNPKTF